VPNRLISNRDSAKIPEGAEDVTFGVCPFARFARNFAQSSPARNRSAASDDEAKQRDLAES
jgi:hypothetical protein